MLIVPLVVGGSMQENTYIVGSEETKECVIIDPGAEADRILEEVESLGVDGQVHPEHPRPRGPHWSGG